MKRPCLARCVPLDRRASLRLTPLAAARSICARGVETPSRSGSAGPDSHAGFVVPARLLTLGRAANTRPRKGESARRLLPVSNLPGTSAAARRNAAALAFIAAEGGRPMVKPQHADAPAISTRVSFPFLLSRRRRDSTAPPVFQDMPTLECEGGAQ